MRSTLADRRTVVLCGALAAMGILRPTYAARRTLTLATGGVWPLVADGGRAGFAQSVVEAAFRRLDVEIQVVSMSMERSLVNADAGIEDGDLVHGPGAEASYPNLVRVPEKVMDFQIVGYAARPDVQARSWSELERYSVAYITGWKTVERNLKQVRDVTVARDMEQLVQLLANGRADVVVVSRWQGLQRPASSMGVTVRRLDPPLGTIPLFTHLHRRHRDLVAPLAAALVELKRDGTWQRLFDQILVPEESRQ